jgi:hypothetical protein
MRKMLLVLFCCVSAFAVVPVSSVANTITDPGVIASQRIYSVSKATCPNSSCAVFKAQKANPGWTVVNIKEMSKVWHLTLKK